MFRLFYVALLIFSASLLAATSKARVLGDPKAVKGGTFTVGLPDYPKSLLYYLSVEELSHVVAELIFEPLLQADLDTNDPIPLLATEWTISKDKKTFTFKLNPNARFSDGKPVTADDVKFTWDTILNPKNKTVPLQSHFASIEYCKVLDPHTVEFRAKTLHFKNLQNLGDLLVLPKHFFSQGDFNKDFNQKLLGSGPYMLAEARQGDRIVFKRNENYWAKDLPQNIGRYNFDKIVLKSVTDPNALFEQFKRGDTDYHFFTIAKMWMTETDGPLFQKNYVQKLKMENKAPAGVMGIYWNERKPLFRDARVRKAMSYLLNREKFIHELFFDSYSPLAGYLGLRSDYRSPKLQPIPYDPKMAKKLLSEAGWNEVDSDGVLKNGELRFEWELLNDSPASLRHLTIYQEDLKKMGIKMNIRTADWPTTIKLMDDRQFDAVELGMTQDVDPSDFKEIFGAAEADMKGSQNIAGYKNAKFDKVAEQVNGTFDKPARIRLVQQLDEILYADQPVTLDWQAKYVRLGHWNRFSFPQKGYFNYSTWRDVFQYWWYDKEKDEKLKKAMASGQPFS